MNSIVWRATKLTFVQGLATALLYVLGLLVPGFGFFCALVIVASTVWTVVNIGTLILLLGERNKTTP